MVPRPPFLTREVAALPLFPGCNLSSVMAVTILIVKFCSGLETTGVETSFCIRVPMNVHALSTDRLQNVLRSPTYVQLQEPEIRLSSDHS